MGNEEADLVKVTNKSDKRSLLEKYDIPVEHLSYEFVSDCSNAKTLERIIRILRSGEEGVYPDLLRHAEERLALVKPTSVVLRKIEPIVKREMLEPNERKEIDNDIVNWMKEMRCREKDLNEGKAMLPDDPFITPEVRQIKDAVSKKKTHGEMRKSGKRISSCDYAAWDKYDADTEINRIDLQEEQRQAEAKEIKRKQRELERARKATQEKAVNKLSLTGTELILMAEQEREKGNEAFRAYDYHEALRYYNSSIQIDPRPVTYNNRAITYIKLGRFEDAVNDCNTVLSMEYKNIKALLRRALSMEHLGKRSQHSRKAFLTFAMNKFNAQALTDYEAILKLEPSNKTAIAAIKKLRKPSESKKVRMKIHEGSDETKQIEQSQIAVCCSNVQSRNKDSSNDLCFCERAPGPSHVSKPFPHIRSTYCLENEKSKTASQTVKASSSPTGNENSVNLKSIFTCKTRGSSSVIIEELPDESFNESKKKLNELKTATRNKSVIINEESRAKGDVTTEASCNDKNHSKESEKESIRTVEKHKSDLNHTSETEMSKNTDCIESPYEFLRVWQSLNNDTDLKEHARLLRRLIPENISAIIGCKLDGAMFSTILHCFERNFCRLEDVELLARFLRSFSELSRFPIVNMFMDEKDKKALKTIFQFLEEQGSTELPSLRHVYNI